MIIKSLFISKVDIYGFFYHALPEESALTLNELHTLVRDVWLTRNDQEIAQEQAARRKGRPKSTKQLKLEELKLQETEEYRTGMGVLLTNFHYYWRSWAYGPEVLDLTHPKNVELLRKWDQTEFAYIQILRFIRITSVKPDVFVVSRPGKHSFLLDSEKTAELDTQNNENTYMEFMSQ
jgi:translation machinery-associated protein 16